MKNVLATLGIAAVTMIATLALLSPNAADAEDGEEAKTAESLVKVTPVIAMPEIEEGEVTVSLKMDKAEYSAGEKPTLTVEFTNHGKEACDKSIDVSMTSRSTISEGRMPAIAVVVWTETVKVSLAAGETKSVTVVAGAEVNGTNAFAFQMAGSNGTVEKEAPAARISRKQVKN